MINMRSIDMIIAGAQKSGTTSLFHYLGQHPSICSHPQSELGFFLEDASYENGYRKAFIKHFSHCRDEKILLAKKAMLMYSRKALQRLYSHNPKVKIILLLRNPIDRAYSAYWYARQRGWERLETFEDAIEAEQQRLKDGWYKWRYCAYLHNSRYADFIEEIYIHFNKRQVHVFLTDDLAQDPIGVSQEIFMWLDISGDFEPNVARLNQTAAARSEILAHFFSRALSSQSIAKKLLRNGLPTTLRRHSWRMKRLIWRIMEKPYVAPPMNSMTREHLAAHFRPHNARLGEMLQRDLGIWG